MKHVFGIIGGGMVARYHAQAIQAIGGDVRLGAIYARDPTKAAALAEEFGCVGYSDLDEMLADSEITIVTIATPSGAHLEPAIAAARAGKHIICEKPLEVTPERCQKMIDVAQSEGVILSGIFNRRFNPAVTALKKAVEAGRFGRLTLCDAHFKWYRTQAYYDSAKWRGTRALDGGGAMMNQGSHTIDLFLYLVGSPVRRVSASVALLTHERIEVEDTAVAIIEFENGALGTIQGATSCWSTDGNPAEIQLCGSDGTVILRDDRFRVWDFRQNTAEDEHIRATLMTDGAIGVGANDPNAIDFVTHQRNFEDVIKSIESGEVPSISGVEAKKAVTLINAIYQSAAADGEWITL